MKYQIYSLLRGIPERFAGRTSACLTRAEAFAQYYKKNIEVLTVASDTRNSLYTKDLTNKLRKENYISHRVRIRNIWSDLGGYSEKSINSNFKTNSLVNQDENILKINDQMVTVTRNETGEVIQSDRYRSDGTLYISERFDIHQKGFRGGYKVTLYSRDGSAVKAWNNVNDLYFDWFDSIFQNRKTVLINDVPALPGLNQYQRDNVLFVQTIHNRHSSDPNIKKAAIGKTYFETLKNFDDYDKVAVLTHEQKDDLIKLEYADNNIEVLPNVVWPSEKRSFSLNKRNKYNGIVLARLDRSKRIDHAVEAISLIKNKYDTANLKIFGQGEMQEELENKISLLGLTGSAFLKGFSPNAKNEFLTSSFTLVTSVYEGFSLVIVEAMARGCIPIAYDVKYGPSEIIEDGVNGFLVEPGNTTELASKIDEFLSLSPNQIHQMRKHALSRAKQFEPKSVVPKWAQMIETAYKDKKKQSKALSKLDAKPKLQAIVERVILNHDKNTINFTFLIKNVNINPLWIKFTWISRKRKAYGRTDTNYSHEQNSEVTVSMRLEELLIEDDVLDFYLDVSYHFGRQRIRIKGKESVDLKIADGYDFYLTKYGNLSLR